jgi:hypothetical protein
VTLPTRLALPLCVLAVWGVPGWAQTAGSIMVGSSPPAGDGARERGVVIAKGTTLPRGHGYVAALAPTLTIGVAYGITDRLTAQVGTTLWTIAEAPSLYGTARYGVVQSTAVNVAVGVFGATIFNGNEADAGVWPYLAMTVGSGPVSLTGLLGVGSSTRVFDSDFNGSVLLQGALEVSLMPALEVVAETLYLGRNTNPAGAVGLRGFVGMMAFEGGLIHVFEPGEPDTALVPWGGVSLRF